MSGGQNGGKGSKKTKINGPAKRNYIEYTVYNLLKKDKKLKAIVLEKKTEITLKKMFKMDKKDYEKVLARLEDKQYIKKTDNGYEFIPA